MVEASEAGVRVRRDSRDYFQLGWSAETPKAVVFDPGPDETVQ